MILFDLAQELRAVLLARVLGRHTRLAEPQARRAASAAAGLDPLTDAEDEDATLRAAFGRRLHAPLALGAAA